MVDNIEAAARAVLASQSEEFVQLVAIAGLSPNRSFKHLDLRGISFSGQDLSGFDFTGSDLRGCDFVGAKLDATVLDNAQLDAEGEAIVSLSSELTKPTYIQEPFVPDIYVDLVGESQDFLQSVSALRALNAEDYIPVHCYLHVLGLASSEATAFSVFESWKDYPGAYDPIVAQALCTRITTRSTARLIADRLDQWRIFPHDILMSFRSKEAKWAFLVRLAEGGVLTEDLLQKLPPTAFHEFEIEEMLGQFRKLSEIGLLGLNLARLVTWARSFCEAKMIFEELEQWNKMLSREECSRFVLAHARTAEEAMAALSIGSEPKARANALRTIRQLSIREARIFLLGSRSSLNPKAALDALLMKSSLGVADHLQLLSFTVASGIAYPKSSLSALSRLRPALLEVLRDDGYMEDHPSWKVLEGHCRSEEEHQALFELRSALQVRRSR